LKEELKVLSRIFTTTRDAIENFIDMLEPVIQNASDEHERLYYHHITEEEEQRLSRLAELIPLISKFELEKEETDFVPANNDFNRLLQELNLEKFGLHNFIEHLDLALFQFTDSERSSKLKQMREISYQDYQQVKEILEEINSRADHQYVDPHKHHDEDHDHLDKHASEAEQNITTNSNVKKFTVGSLIK
jgi:hypothetical protein